MSILQTLFIDMGSTPVYLGIMKKEEPRKVEFYQQLGAQIRKFRKHQKLSQDVLAKLVGLARTSLTNIERGRQHPPLHTLSEIVAHLKVDISDLLPSPEA